MAAGSKQQTGCSPGTFHAGQLLLVHGLASQQGLNGSVVELLSYKADSARWAARVLGSRKPVSIKPCNLLDPHAEQGLEVGCRAHLQLLARRADLNGEAVELLVWAGDSGRWAVRVLSSGTSICVRPENLCPPPVGGPAPLLERIVGCVSDGGLALESRADRGKSVFARGRIEAGSVLFREEPWLQMPMRGHCICLDASFALARHVRASRHLSGPIDQLYDGAGKSSAFMDRIDADAGSGQEAAWLRRWGRVWNLNAFLYHGKNQALFLAGSMLNHSCAPNAIYQTFSGERAAVFRALRTIHPGEEVTLDYTTCAKPTAEARRRQLREEKLFACDCQRCRAPDWSRSLGCPAAGCRGAAAPDAPGDTPDAQAWRCTDCGRTYHDEELPLAAEAWIGALVVDHDARFSLYTHEHFVATLLLALNSLGPRHWTANFMASLLLENASSKGGRGITTSGPLIVCLARFYFHWAQQMAPADVVTTRFAERMLAGVRGLLGVGMQDEAAALAAKSVDAYQGVWGGDDHDTVFLRGVAEGADLSAPFLDRFSWEDCRNEIYSTCITDCEGNPDSGRILRACRDLQRALARGADPHSTMHLGHQ